MHFNPNLFVPCLQYIIGIFADLFAGQGVLQLSTTSTNVNAFPRDLCSHAPPIVGRAAENQGSKYSASTVQPSISRSQSIPTDLLNYC